MTNLPPELQFEKTMYRSGLQPRGGSITRRPRPDGAGAESQGLQSWANGFAGLFVVDKRQPGTFDSQMTALRDVIVCGFSDSSIEVAAGSATFEASGSTLNICYLPRGTHVRYSAGSSAGVRSVSIMLDVHSFAEAQGIHRSEFPRPLRDLMDRKECVMESVAPSHSVTQVVEDIILRRGMYSALPAMFLEGKTLQLLSSWMCHLSHDGSGQRIHYEVDHRTRKRLAIVKELIDRSPVLALNIESLAKAAAMNRTKLRTAFRAVYGMTLVEYRTAVAMQRAQQFLEVSGATVNEAARSAGYANASSFIVAFKRHFGASPGNLRRS